MKENVIEISHLTKSYGKSRGVIDVSLNVKQGDIFGFLGPNGAGKSTLLKILAGIYSPTSGEILYEGIPVSGKGASWEQRRRMQRETGLILQDAAASLNPRMTVEKLISESLHIRRMPSRREEITSRRRSCSRAIST